MESRQASHTRITQRTVQSKQRRSYHEHGLFRVSRKRHWLSLSVSQLPVFDTKPGWSFCGRGVGVYGAPITFNVVFPWAC